MTDSATIKADRNCQQKDLGSLFRKEGVTKEPRKTMLMVLPNVSSNPANGLLLGVAGSAGFYLGPRQSTRVSSLRFNFAYTTKNQFLAFAKSNIYTNGDKFFLQGDWRYFIYNALTWGLGTSAPDSIESKNSFVWQGAEIGDTEDGYQMLYNVTNEIRMNLLRILFIGLCCMFILPHQAYPNVQENMKPVNGEIPLEIRKNLDEVLQKRSLQNKMIIDSLRKFVTGYPVKGVMNDTLFYIYEKVGANTPSERATLITNKIGKVYKDDYFNIDSIFIVPSDYTLDIVYGEIILIGVSQTDALWYDKSLEEVANEFKAKIENSILRAREERNIFRFLGKAAQVFLVLVILWIFIRLINQLFSRTLRFVERKKENWVLNLSYKDYTFLHSGQQMAIVSFILKMFRWMLYVILLYLALPVILSFFPFTKGWGESLFGFILTPLKSILISIWGYLPSLFRIVVIYFIMRLVLRLVRYIFTEIAEEKLRITGFHADWAMPTHSIARIVLFAFTLVLIFPYLPGSDSMIFKGVSVFIGVLFSLGSSSVVSNTMAGLVITYMRPFKLGDRIRIGEITGIVIEKNLLVTRLRTIKNEEITLPNTSILSGSTTNYSAYTEKEGLIIHTTVTIGYDVPWRDMHQALIDAAMKTVYVNKNPLPFVHQTGLDDFYVSYQLNAYISEPGKIAGILSNLHQNIQDVCNERGIEILSPHYRAERDGNASTIPAAYLPKDYQSPPFKVFVEK
jgi:small-conductance mechanosensitive channel